MKLLLVQCCCVAVAQKWGYIDDYSLASDEEMSSIGEGEYTFKEAQALCETKKDCVGFTYEHSSKPRRRWTGDEKVNQFR